MALKTINESILTAIGNAIRAKLGVATTYKPSEMAAAIGNIQTPNLDTLEVTENGTYTPTAPKNGFSQVDVDVPNSYAASDEGKVVSEGALVAQTSKSINSNGTHDTTTNNQVVVEVTPNLQEKTALQNGDVLPDSGYDGLSKVAVNVSGGGSLMTYKLLGYYTDPLGDSGSSSYTHTISGQTVGKKLVLVVMHRKGVNTPTGFTRIHTTSDGWQFISVFEKISTVTSESITISFESISRYCLAAFMLSSDTTITYNSKIQVDTSITNKHIYTIPSIDKPKLVVCSIGYAGGGATWGIGIQKNVPALPTKFGLFATSTEVNNSQAYNYKDSWMGEDLRMGLAIVSDYESFEIIGKDNIQGTDDSDNAWVYIFELS